MEYDPEEIRVVAKTWREYLGQAHETFDGLAWAWRELKTPETVRRYRHLLVAAILMAVFQAVQPRILAVVFDGAGHLNARLALLGLAGFLVCMLFQKITDWWFASSREWLFGLNMGMLDRRITERFFEKSLGQHVEESTRLSPEGVSTGRERLLNAQGMLFFEGIPAITGLTFSYVALWFLSPVAAGLMSGSIGAYVAWMLYLNRKVIDVCTPLETNWRKQKRYRFERWKNVERVKTSAKEDEELAYMKARFEDTIFRDRFFWLWFIKHCILRQLVQNGGLLATMTYGVWLVLVGRWPLALLYPLFTWGMQITESIWRIGHIERELNWNMPSIKLMIEGLSIPPKIVSQPGAIVLARCEPITLAFEGITHAYPLDGDDLENENGGGSAVAKHPPCLVLKNVTLSVGRGEKVAIIGPSGAGKTTLMRLLLRFMDPGAGVIRVNGHDLRTIDLGSWMRAVSYIPQHAQILNGTLRYNLTYGLTPTERELWTDDKLWELMRKLRIDFGERLTDGLETVVGERGVKLSGGQAQRVMIGAAAIQRPPFMVIDEATSHLDSTTEREVHDGLRSILAEDIGALVIAHRLSTVRDLCGRFIVLKNPEDVRNGDSQVEAIANSFGSLYAISPTFRRLADDQGLSIPIAPHSDYRIVPPAFKPETDTIQ